MEDHIDLSSIVSSYSFSKNDDSDPVEDVDSMEVDPNFLDLKKHGNIKDRIYDTSRMKE